MTAKGLWGEYKVKSYHPGSLPDGLMTQGVHLTVSPGEGGTAQIHWSAGSASLWLDPLHFATPGIDFEEDLLFNADTASVHKSESEPVPLTAVVVFRKGGDLRGLLLAPTNGPPATFAAEAHPNYPV